MTDLTTNITAVTAQVLKGAKAKLRKAFPCLTEDALQNAIQATSLELQRKLAEQIPAMTASHTRAHLNMLPAELRIRIYEYVLARDDDKPFRTNPNTYRKARAQSVVTITQRTAMPALLRLDRQIRSEALPIFYSQTTFVIVATPTTRDQRYFGEWLKLVGDRDAAMIRRLVVWYESRHRLNPLERKVRRDAKDVSRKPRKQDAIEDVGLGGCVVPYGSIRVAYGASKLSGCKYIND